MKSSTPLEFKPRILPRNWFDFRISALAIILLTPIIVLVCMLWIIGCFQLVYQLSDNLLVGATASLFACSIGMLYGQLMPVQRLKFTEQGIHTVRLLGIQLITWEEIESVEELSPSAFTRKMCDLHFYTGRMACPSSLTFTDYVLIHHNRGSILFPPENKEIFLHELRKYRERKQAKQNQEAAKTTPWYWTAQALREENQQTLRSRSLD